MDWSSVNYASIIVSTVAAWLFGAVYYTVLSRQWLAAQGRSGEEMKAQMAGKSGLAKSAPFILGFLCTLLMAFVFYGVLVHIKTFSLRAGLISAAFIWVGFVLTTMAVNNAFTSRSPKLTMIDSLHWLGVMLIIGAIVGAWGQ